MRISTMVWISLVVLSGCAARQRPAARAYACDGAVIQVVRGAETLSISGSEASLVRRDSAGAHYRDGVLEYVLPADPREDALVWDGGALRDVCTARGGYTDVLGRWIAGESLDDIAVALDLDGRRDARLRVLAALRWVRKQVPEGRVHPARVAVE
jgi:hypothetical protein